MDRVERAANAISAGELVVYPTETVYGLGANALDPDAVARVFDVKRRPREKPLSIAVPDVETALTFVEPTERELAFMRRFLPGPVTVIVERRPIVPSIVTGGRSRVGIRIPDHYLALALLEATAPITATSANVSGGPDVRTVTELDSHVRKAAAVVLDGGETDGTASTVVDVDSGTIHRRGANADEIETWIADR